VFNKAAFLSQLQHRKANAGANDISYLKLIKYKHSALEVGLEYVDFISFK